MSGEYTINIASFSKLKYKVNEKITLFPKHPSGRRKYTVNMVSSDGTTNNNSSSDNGFLKGRTISSLSTSALSTTGYTWHTASNTTKAFTIDVSGGTVSNDYEIDLLVTLSTSEIEPITLILPVRDYGDN